MVSLSRKDEADINFEVSSSHKNLVSSIRTTVTLSSEDDCDLLSNDAISSSISNSHCSIEDARRTQHQSTEGKIKLKKSDIYYNIIS